MVKKINECDYEMDIKMANRIGIDSVIFKTVDALLESRNNLKAFEHISSIPKPSFKQAKELIQLTQQIVFPGFFSSASVTERNIEYHLGTVCTDFYTLLSKEIAAAIRYDCRRNNLDCTHCIEKGAELALEIVEKLVDLRKNLSADVVATKEGDPAAGDHLDQIIFCYPGLFATLVYRLAHELFVLEVPFLPRILTEYAHAKTGIDIHPGAKIGSSFFIDHGTGVVIGETTIIGCRVRIYQGVTLGALSLPKDAGVSLKGKKRHPTLEDDVIVYSGATILGGETVIGTRSVIGGNVWLIESVGADTRVLMKKPELLISNSVKK